MTLDQALEIARAVQNSGVPQYIAEHGAEDVGDVMAWLANTLGPALPCMFETPTNTIERGIDCGAIVAMNVEEAQGVVADVIRATEREPVRMAAEKRPVSTPRVTHWTKG